MEFGAEGGACQESILIVQRPLTMYGPSLKAWLPFTDIC